MNGWQANSRRFFVVRAQIGAVHYNRGACFHPTSHFSRANRLISKSIHLPLALISLSLLSAHAFAQDNFPDTPTNHWAYQALVDLKAAGILVGYPDGLYRGTRPMSRYEMAVAMNAAYIKVKSQLDAIQSPLDSLKNSLPTSEDLITLRDLLGRVQDQLDTYKTLGPEISDLKRAADTFELELEQLGVNVEAMKSELNKLSDRISALEKKKSPIDIHGDINFWLGAGTSRNSLYGLNKDGRLEGTSSPGGVDGLFPPVDAGVGLEHDNTILQETAFTLSGSNEKGPKWSATLVETNMFGNYGGATPTYGFGNQSDVFSLASGNNPNATGLFGYAPGQEDIYLQNGSIQIGGPTAHVEVGRVAYSLDPYMFRRLDNTSYFSNDRWDNGKYYFDGAIAGSKLGFAELTVFGGLDSAVQSLQGVQIDPVRSGTIGGPFSPTTAAGGGLNTATGTLSFDRHLGADVKVGLGKTANLDFGYVLLEGDTLNLYGQDDNVPIDASASANHLSVYGADADWRIGPVKIEGGYHKSDVQENTQTVVGTDNDSWNAKATFGRPAFGLDAEYRQVAANYVAPGDWGRLGVLRNPTNIKGLQVGGHIKFLKRFKFEASGVFDSGLSNEYAISTYLGTGTNIREYDVRLSYELSRAWSLFADLENTHFQGLAAPSNYAGSGDPNYKWGTIGVNYHFNQNSLFNLEYEHSDVDNDYQVSGGSNFHGGFVTSQLTVKF
jgi:hypothetical protein